MDNVERPNPVGETSTHSERRNPVIYLLQLLIVFGIPFLPMLISGRWNWWEAWFVAVVFILGFVGSRVLAVRRHPDIMKERIEKHADAQPWDKLLAPMAAYGVVLVLLVIGLEARSSGSPPFSPALKIAALLTILAGYAFSTWALVENRFFSGVVRIQSERGHAVVSGGPYRYVRHPGYAGTLLTYLAIPIFLDSRWGLLTAVLVCAGLVLRTALEDRFLQANLPGYREYAARVRYRLLPGVW